MTLPLQAKQLLPSGCVISIHKHERSKYKSKVAMPFSIFKVFSCLDARYSIMRVLLLIFLITAVSSTPASKLLKELEDVLEAFEEKQEQLALNQQNNEQVVQEPRPVSVPSTSYDEREKIVQEPRPTRVPNASFAHSMQDDECPHWETGCYLPCEVDICGVDDRVIIDNPVGMTPNQWICRLAVHSTRSDGSHIQWTGSAFKVKISPNVGRTVLFTAAHVIRKGHIGEYVNSIDVQCPGEDEVRVVRNSDQDMWMPNEFLNGNPRDRPPWDHDYAYLTYPGDSNTGFGWQGFMDAAAIIAAGTTLHSCGYPTQQDTCISRRVLPVSPPPDPKQYCSEGNLDRIDENRVYARVDMDFGQSGGPLYVDTGNNYVAYGIVSLPSPGCPAGKEYHRLTAEKLYNMFSHMGGLQMRHRIRSSETVYLHMDGVGLNSANRVGGSVYAGYLSNVDDAFMIFPIQQSSSNQPDSQLVAIRSASQNNVYLRMDGTGLVATQLRGGGMVNCRFGIDNGDKEVFHKEVEPDGQVAFRSKTYNDVYLRIDHWTVGGPADRGTVNAQFGKFTLETHHLEPLPVQPNPMLRY